MLISKMNIRIIKLINVDIRIKYREIIFTSILCYLTIRTKIYKHHFFSLIIISFFVILLLILEILAQIKKKKYMDILWEFLLLQTIINICRVFSDTIEKYLLEFNFVDPFKVRMIKGIIQTLLVPLFYIFDKPREEITYLFNLKGNKIIILVILLLIYFPISGISNIYKILTIKIYSPMTRALFDSF